MRKILLYLTILIQLCFAQNFEFTTYPLQSNFHYDKRTIIQDDEGKIWVQQLRGITYIYDGYKWESKRYWNDSKGTYLYNIFCDDKKKIWGFLSDSRTITMFDGKKFNECYKIKDRISFVFTNVINEDDGDKIVAVSYDEILIIKNGKEKYFDLTRTYPDIRVTDVKIINKKVYFASNQGFFSLNSNTIQKISLPKELNDSFILNFLFDEETSKYFFFLADKIISFDGQTTKVVSKFNNVLNDFSKALQFKVFLKEGNDIFFGNYFSFHHCDYKTGKVTTIDQEKGLVGNGVNALIIDREKNFWTASRRGVTKLVKKNFSIMNQETGLLENEVTAILEDNGKIYLGQNSGISILENNKIKKFAFEEHKRFPKSGKRCYKIIKTSDGRVLAVCSIIGLVEITDNGLIYHSSKKNKEIYMSIAEAGNNELIIIADDGLRWLNSEYQVVKRFYTKIGGRNLKQLSENHILVIMNEGFYIINKKNRNIEKIFKDFKLPTYNMLKVKERYLFPTKHGVYFFDPQTLKQEPVDSALTNCSAYFAHFDADSNIWIGTNKGVYIKHNNELINFNDSDGLPFNETNRNAFLLDNKKNVWIGTGHGLIKFFGVPKTKKTVKPKAKIIGITDLNDNYISKDSVISLNPEQNNFKIHFRGLSFINEKVNTFEIVLKNLTQNISHTFYQKDVFYNFINQQPGEYNIQVKMKNANGDWSDPASLNVIIDSPYYLKSWFLILVFVVFGIFIVFIVRYINNKNYADKLKNDVEEQTHSLNVTNKKYQLISENVDEVIFSFDENIKLNFVSPTLEYVLGYKPEMFFRFDERFSLVYSFLSKNGSENLDEFKTKNQRAEIDFHNKNGEEKILEIISSPIIAENEFQGLISVVRDITTLKKREKEKTIAIVNSIEKERGRIARELHDHIGQIIASVKLRLELFKMQTENNSHINAAHNQIGIVRSEIRNIIDDLSQIPGGKSNFCYAIKDYLDTLLLKSNITVVYKSDYECINKSDTEKLMMFRIIQEAINNAIVHAKPEKIYVSINTKDQFIEIIIQDDGRGFDLRDKQEGEHYGILNMKQRIELLEGNMTIDSFKNEGTTIKILVKA